VENHRTVIIIPGTTSHATPQLCKQLCRYLLSDNTGQRLT